MLTTTTNTLGWSVSQSADTQKCTPALPDPAPANHGQAQQCSLQMRHDAAAAGLLRRLWHGAPVHLEVAQPCWHKRASLDVRRCKQNSTVLRLLAQRPSLRVWWPLLLNCC